MRRLSLALLALITVLLLLVGIASVTGTAGLDGPRALGGPSSEGVSLTRWVQRLTGLGVSGSRPSDPETGQLEASGEASVEPTAAGVSVRNGTLSEPEGGSGDSRQGLRDAPPLGGPGAGLEAAALPRDTPLSGRVVDATGGPVPGARLVALGGGGGGGASPALYVLAGPTPLTAPRTEFTSDAEGNFRTLVPSGNLVLTASADAYASARKVVRAPAEDVVIVLVPGGRVEGRVIRDDQSPVEQAAVEVRHQNRRLEALSAATNAHGEFSITGVPTGIVVVEASAPGLRGPEKWLRLGVAEAPTPIVLTLSAARSLHGVVRVGGAPCEHGVVQVGGPLNEMSEVGADGHYRVEGLSAGEHSVTVLCMGVSQQTGSVEFAGDASQSIELNWDIDAGFSLTGSVTRSTGEPAAGASIWVMPAASPESPSGSAARPSHLLKHVASQCVSDAAGNFECKGLSAGWYQGRATAGSGAESEAVRVDAQSKPRIQLTLPALGGIVVTLSDDPKGVGVSLGVFARGDQPVPIPGLIRGSAFVFEDLALGRYRVGVGRGLGPDNPNAVDVELSRPGQIARLELKPPELIAIAGSVVDGEALPVPDAWVSASPALQGFPLAMNTTEPVLTNSEGVFELTGLAPGHYDVSVVHPLGEARALDLQAGRRDVKLVLEGYGEVAGVATLASGQPVPQFSVLAIREPVGEPRTIEGWHGAWSVPWIAAGDYRVTVLSDRGGATAQLRIEAGKKAELQTTLDPNWTAKTYRGIR